jgi:outer membrane protein TolC
LLERAVELARLMGREIDASAAELRTSDEPQRAARVPRLDGVLQVALTGNLDLLTARANLLASRVDAEVASNARLPQLDVGAAGGPAGIASSLGRAWSQLGHFGGYSVQGSLTFQQPTLNRAARGSYVSARAAVSKADLDETLVRQQVQANAVRLVAAADNAARRLTILNPSIDSANRDLEAARAQFAVGRNSNFDVLRRQDEVADVQLRQLRARVDYEQAIAAVDALTGEILPRMGVKLR